MVTPTETTTYTLTVTNAAGTRVTQSLEVIVKPFLTGYFTDSAVEGLNYATETQSGITNNLGAFTYLEGETISFTIGTFVLGDTVAAKAAMTPLDLTAPSLSLPTTNGELNFLNKKVQDTARPFGEGINFAKFQNLLVLLQSLDSDKDASNGISIPDGMSALLEGVSLDFEAKPPNFRAAFALRNVMAEATSQGLIDSRVVKNFRYALAHYYERQEISASFTVPSVLEIDFGATGIIDRIDTFTYDANGNVLTEEEDATGDGVGIFVATRTYTYDANGNVLTDANAAIAKTATYSYDANENQLTKSWYNDADGLPDEIITYTYDANGNKLTESYDSDADGLPDDITTYTYDAGGNMLTVSYEYGAVSLANGEENSIAKSTYDANGNRLTESYDHNGNGTIDSIITNTYDANGNQLTRSNDNNADGTIDSISTYTYDANGNQLTASYDNNADGTIDSISTYTYDAYRNLLNRSNDNNADGTIDSIFTYNTYDANGNQLTYWNGGGFENSPTTITNVETTIAGFLGWY